MEEKFREIRKRSLGSLERVVAWLRVGKIKKKEKRRITDEIR